MYIITISMVVLVPFKTWKKKSIKSALIKIHANIQDAWEYGSSVV